MKIKVFIYDDNRSRRESLELLLLSHQGMEPMGSKPDCSDVINDMQIFQPDVVLMDIQMPGVDGIQGAKMIHENFPNIRVIMQTVFEDDDKVFQSLKNGASGYILKKASPEKVIEAIFDVYNGGAPITPTIAIKVLQFFSTIKQPRERTVEEFLLTGRENEILSLLKEGLSYKMIAERCGISVFTVNAHIRKIYEKLKVHSATEAIAKTTKT
jgi:DNA-binding NarL/FixJ family response regulator